MVYEEPEDARKAIEEYHGAYLDDKLLTVEFDAKEVMRLPKANAGGLVVSKRSGGGKTLKLGGRH